jgi:anti-sigma regulatory factor (Ser/Thr protein kinase)
VPTAGTDRTWCVVVPHQAAGARQARHRFTAALEGLLPGTFLADAVAVMAELVGNAVRHARPLDGGVVRVAWRLVPEADPEAAARHPTVEIRVTDGGSTTPPTQREADAEAPDGRGLTIVAALSDSWGVDCDGLGQCVWARLTVPRTRRTGPLLAGAGA